MGACIFLINYLCCEISRTMPTKCGLSDYKHDLLTYLLRSIDFIQTKPSQYILELVKKIWIDYILLGCYKILVPLK